LPHLHQLVTNVICNTTIRGNLVIGRSGHGAPWDLGQCGPNTIRGHVVWIGHHDHPRTR
jgi:hypothetical protein